MALLEYEFWSYDKTKKIIVSEPWSWLNIKFTISLIQSRTAISLHVTVQFFLRPSIYKNFTIKIQSADEKSNEKSSLEL